jgi:hypothetical protein
MLLILSETSDAHIPFVRPKLDERGVDYVWFDPACFPAEAQLSLGFSSTGITRRTLRLRDREIDLSQVTAVWDRRPGTPQANQLVRDETQKTFVELASRVFAQGFWETLECRWLPGRPAAARQAENKLVQLALAARLGFTIPDTLIGNDPAAFLEFAASTDSSMLTKSLVNLDVQRDGQAHVVVFSHMIRRRDFVKYQSIRHAPAIFQPYVAKQVELRVTVVGDRVFAAEIGSQSSRLTRVDWRHYEDRTVPYVPHSLPVDVAQRCFELVRALGLEFGALDFILTPEGDYVFLEINPNGQWGFIELSTGLPIADAVVDYLTGQMAIGVN